MTTTLRKLSVLAALFCIACTRPDPTPDPEPQKDFLAIEYSEKSFSNKSAEFTLDVDANCEWNFTVDADWAYVIEPKTSYKGSKTLTIDIKKNNTTAERSAIFSFNYSGGCEKLKITQAGFEVYLDVSETSLSFGYRTVDRIITVTSNCGWEASSSASWLTIKPITGLVGSFEMTVNVATNNSMQDRSASILVWNDSYSLSRTIEVHQEGQSKVNDKDYIDEYDINYGQGITLRGLTWAPVNLGYHHADFPFGKMFQWGRKAGIGYKDEVYGDAMEVSVCDVWEGENGKESPTSFYKYGEKSKFAYDWILQGDNSFWNKGTEENPAKNADYDPCPDGWRIPTAFEFRSLLDYVDKTWITANGVSGYDFSQKAEDESAPDTHLFIPAAGRINAADGISYDRNVEGYYWTISANEGSSAYMFFYHEGQSVNSQGSRAGGCSIRCVKE